MVDGQVDELLLMWWPKHVHEDASGFYVRYHSRPPLSMSTASWRGPLFYALSPRVTSWECLSCYMYMVETRGLHSKTS